MYIYITKMVRKCCVPDCRSNYLHTKCNVSTFSFPKDPKLRAKWINKIKRKNFIPNDRSAVCIEHFVDEFIIRKDSVRRDDGSILTLRRKVPKLAKHAYPTIFPTLPPHLNRPPSPTVKTDEELQRELEKSKEEEKRLMLEKDKITDFKMFQSTYKTKNLYNFLHLPFQDHIMFFKLNSNCLSSVPKIMVSITINSNLKTQVTYGGGVIPLSKYKFLLNHDCVNRWSKFEALLGYFEDFKLESIKIVCNLYAAAQLIKECIHKCKDNQLQSKLKFLHEQINLCCTTSPRYSADLIVRTSSWFFNERKLYTMLRESNLMSLPTPSRLKNIVISQTQNELIDQLEVVPDNENLINLVLSERVCLKNMNEIATEEDNQENIIIQVFSKYSLINNNHDIIGLLPKVKRNSKALYEFTILVIKTLTEANYKIVSLILDNNNINREVLSMFYKESECFKPTFSNPFRTSDEIFILFDTQNLFKSIRDDWIAQKDLHQSFLVPYCPPFKDTEEVDIFINANFSDIKNLYSMRHTIDKDFQLSKKVIHPSINDRDNIIHVINLFDEDIAEAMSQKKDSFSEGTILFIRLIKKWWKIVNLKENTEPNSGNEQPSTIFLAQFSDWLEKWNKLGLEENLHIGKLSKETYFALKHTTDTYIILTDYLINKLHMKNISLSKFQNDSLALQDEMLDN